MCIRDRIIRALKICGGCNVQLALDPASFKYYIIEVNPRVSRSSALASKATGYPIAKIAAKIAVGLTLDEIINPITNTSYACFEPALDYVVTKLPRFPFDKFPHADRRLGTQMKATGEVMAIGRCFEESFLKAIRSLEMKCDHIENKESKEKAKEELWNSIAIKDDQRMFGIAELLRRKESLSRIHDITKIDTFFLEKFAHIIALEERMKQHPKDTQILWEIKRCGFADSFIARSWGMEEKAVYNLRKQHGICPVYKMVDTCAAEFEMCIRDR